MRFLILFLIFAVSRTGLYAQPADTVRILAIRADFAVDDDDFTTGDGTFMLAPPGGSTRYDTDYEEYPYDTPPHNKRFFEDHLKALATYYNAVSYGQLVIQYRVLPDPSDSVYHLPGKKKDYYNKHRSFSIAQSDSQLIGFSKAALAWADSVSAAAGDTLPFSAYNCRIVFFAGADGRTDQDDTYGDIPSKYLDFTNCDDSLVVADSTRITDCLIIPETINQDGIIGVLNATLAYQFGHYLGLPSLFFSEEGQNHGVPAVGFFSLMDVGTWLPDSGEIYLYGAVPPHLGPWEKIQLGWLTPVELDRQSSGSWTLDPAERKPHAYKIPLNSTEYLLVENRQNDLNRESATHLEQDSVSSVILHPGMDTTGGDTVYEYDDLLPGKGLVVWQVDESAFDRSAEPVKVNLSIDRQGIDVLEADGKQEIGYLFTYGSKDDFFYPKKNSLPELTPATSPGTNSRSGAASDIHITAIDTLDSLRMKFTLGFDRTREGWPRAADSTGGLLAPAAGRLDNDDTLEVVCATKAGRIFAWHHTGQGVADSATGFFAACAAPVSGAPALGDLDGDSLAEVVAGDTAGSLYVWKTTGGTVASLHGSAIKLDGAVTGSPVLAALDSRDGLDIAVGTASGKLYTVNRDSVTGQAAFPAAGAVYCAAGDVAANGDSAEIAAVWAGGSVRLYKGNLDSVPLWEQNVTGMVRYPPVLGDTDGDGEREVFVLAGASLYCFGPDGHSIPGWPVTPGDSLTSALACADVDNDGGLDLVVCGVNTIYAYNRAGNRVNGYPLTIDRTDPAGAVTGGPVFGNLETADDEEIIFGLGEGDVRGIRSGSGSGISGWPLSTGSGVSVAPLYCDLEGDGTGEVIIAEDNGQVNIWNTAAVYKTSWGALAADVQRTGVYSGTAGAAAAGQALLSSVYNYPNPVKKDRTFIRYHIGAAGAKVTIMLFDFAGELVDEFSGAAVSYTDNEIAWDVTKIQTGVYYCRVEAKDATGTSETKFCTIAIIK